MKRTIIQLPEEQHEWLRQQAHEQKISIAELIRRIIDAARGEKK